MSFQSVCLSDERAQILRGAPKLPEDLEEKVWEALCSEEYFPALIEVVRMETFSEWLPEGAKLLLKYRPEINLRSSDHVHVSKLAALTPEEQQRRRAQWDEPTYGTRRAGARSDDRYQ